MEDASVIELLFSLMPFVLLGATFFIFGIKSKNKYILKCKNAVKATVTNVVVKEERSSDGYFKGNKYILELTYFYNGAQVVKNYDSYYEYDIDSVIDLDIENGSINTILNKPSKDVMDNLRSLNLQWYQVLLGVAYFLLGFGLLSFLLNMIDLYGEEYKYLECIVFAIIMLCLYVFINKKKEKMNDKYKLITGGGYSSFIGKVIDLKKEVRHSDGKVHTSYYPVVEYNDGLNIKKKVIYINGNYVINQNMIIYKDRISGDILSEQEVKFLNIKIKILGYLNVGVIILTGLGVLSFF